MKTQLVMTALPATIVGGMILFLGCGAESQKTGRGESEGKGSTIVAGAPATTNPPAAAVQPVPGVAIAPPQLSPGVEDIVQLAQSGVGEEVIQAYIENSTVPYRLNIDEILYLHDLGLSAETIGAMVRRGQTLQDQSSAGPSTAPPVATASAPETNTNPVPPADNDRAPTTAYAITPPQQVNYNYFYQTLAPYGTWLEVPDYGWCWQPTVAVVDVGWRPYCNRGRWLWTDCGWYWQSDYSWGWAPFHYGRWCRSPDYGWVWSPDTVWGPAWVTWRYSDTYCGWAPLPPGAYFDVGVGFRYRSGGISVGFDFGLVPDCYTFIPTAYFCHRTPWYYCLPRTQVLTVINHTTIINNYATGSNRHSIVNVGPGINAIAKVTRQEIRKVTLRDANPSGGTVIKADRLERDGRSLAVFRPDLPPQRSAPPPEITRHQQETRKRSELLAKSDVVKLATAGNERKTAIAPSTRVSGETAPPARGTPLLAPRATGRAPASHAADADNSRRVVGGQPGQRLEPSTRTPAISRNPRSERRSSDPSPSSPVNGRAFPAGPAPRTLAENSPGNVESPAVVREGRSPVYRPPSRDQPEWRSQPMRREPFVPADRPPPVYQPPASPQTITPPVNRQGGRTFESPPAYFSPPQTPTTVAPRAAEPRYSPPAYQPPPQQHFSPPPVAPPRAIEAPVARPSGPPPSYSPPPAVSRPQPAPAPSSSPSQSRNDGGRKP